VCVCVCARVYARCLIGFYVNIVFCLLAKTNLDLQHKHALTRTNIHTHALTHGRTVACTHTCIYTPTHKHPCSCTHTHTLTRKHTHILTHTHTLTRKHTHINTLTYTQTNTHTHTHVHTHTHTHRCFGFDTAVEEAQRALLAAKVEAGSARKGIGLVKLMGRQSGFIAMQASMASGERHSPFFLLFPFFICLCCFACEFLCPQSCMA
jgi:hypothetical protein